MILSESSQGDVGSTHIPGDPPHSQITIVKFDRSNYVTWSKSFLIYIQSRDKEDYLTGELVVFPKTDSRYQKWKAKNATVMGWLLGSMKPKISDHYLFLETAHQI